MSDQDKTLTLISLLFNKLGQAQEASREFARLAQDLKNLNVSGWKGRMIESGLSHAEAHSLAQDLRRSAEALSEVDAKAEEAIHQSQVAYRNIVDAVAEAKRKGRS